MTINVLYLTPWFPTSKHDPRAGFILDSIMAQEALGVNAQIAITYAWRPKQAIQFLENKKNHKIHSFRYLSIPRYHFRYVSNWSYILRFSRIIARLVTQHNIHLINAHTEIAGMVAVRVGKRMNIPTVVTVHGIETCPKMWIGAAGQMIDHALEKASRVVVVGEPLLDYFQQRLASLDHFRVVHNGFRLYPDMLNVLEKEVWSNNIKLISVSNLNEGKGVDITIRALAALKSRKIDNWSYTIVGEGAQRQALEKLVNQLNLTQHIVFIGLCSHDKVCQHLKAANVFCLPSYREAFGIAYLEAMAYGLLAIGVEGEGPQAFIKHHETGLLVKPRDVESLVNTLLAIFQQRERMQKIAKQGRAHVLQQFTWRNHAEVLLKVYQEIL